ncbi:MAG: YbaL family putative K(+) efflux transporter [Steroidobacteraceae bacterium]
MPHETALLATIAMAFVLAFGLGLLASLIRLPPLVGYLIAGVAMGPFTPGYVGDLSLASQLSEIGVILLMFGVGLHFSTKDLMAVRRIAIPGAIGQIVVATLLGALLAWTWGWNLAAGFTLGLSLSVASTVVLLKALEQQGKLDTAVGRIAVGWLIVEDLVMVLALVLIPAFATSMGSGSQLSIGAVAWLLGGTLAKVAAFVALALLVGTRFVPWLLTQVARTGSRELFTLAVLAIALGIAFGASALFGVSFALGAFFAGVILAESNLSHRAAEESLPLRDAFAVLFFVAVGMLFDPSIVVREPLQLLGVMLIILIGKSIAAFLIMVLFRFPISTALTVSASLAQIGEFSFILAALGVGLELLPEDGRDLILGGAILSITVNQLFFALQPRVEKLLRSWRGFARWADARAQDGKGDDAGVPPLPPLSGHVIVIGHGRVGGAITPVLQQAGQPYVVIDRDRSRFEALRTRGVPVLYGDAAQPGVLEAAGIERARVLVVGTAESFQARRAVELARAANPQVAIFARTHSHDEQEALRTLGADDAVMGEHELALQLTRLTLQTLGLKGEASVRLSDEL